MTHQESKPNIILSDYIKCIWLNERYFDISTDKFEILPDSYLELIFCIDSFCYLIINKKKIKLPKTFLVGLLEKPMTISSDGLLTVVGIRFYSWNFLRFWGSIPKNGITNDVLNEKIKIFTKKIQEKIIQEKSYNIPKAIEQELMIIAREISLTDKYKYLSNFTIKLIQDSGKSKINFLLKDFKISKRSMEKNFKENTGYKIKEISRKIRFEKIRDKIWEDPLININDLVYDFNYFDQSRLINDFKKIAGITPKSFAKKAIKEKKFLKNSLTLFYN